MKKVVISLGGSVMIPDKINYKFLENFKKTLRKHYRTHKFVIVCGGGVIARKYIEALRAEGRNRKELSLAGIRATRMNAMFLIQFFGKEANDVLPRDMIDVRNELEKNNVVICGALRYDANSTSDGTAAKLAHHLKADFINITNVDGLYSDDPRKNRNAKLIRNISWKEFERIALKIKFEAGQHFVLDQNAAVMIRKNRIRTAIIGPEVRELEKAILGKKFNGTEIYGNN